MVDREAASHFANRAIGHTPHVPRDRSRASVPNRAGPLAPTCRYRLPLLGFTSMDEVLHVIQHEPKRAVRYSRPDKHVKATVLAATWKPLAVIRFDTSSAQIVLTRDQAKTLSLRTKSSRS
jgi:hypothetical protein